MKLIGQYWTKSINQTCKKARPTQPGVVKQLQKFSPQIQQKGCSQQKKDFFHVKDDGVSVFCQF